jgi:hypothetical protein
MESNGSTQIRLTQKSEITRRHWAISLATRLSETRSEILKENLGKKYEDSLKREN